MAEKKICFVNTLFSPEYLGGTNLFHKNIINYIYSKKKNITISWVYFGKTNRRFVKDKIEYIELKSPFLFGKSLALVKFFKKNYFDIINTHTSIWVHFYPKKKEQRIIQTFHGTRFYFNKNHYGRLPFIKKIFLLGLLLSDWIVDMPSKKIDNVICVSEKTKRQVEKLYGKQNNISVIRAGANLDSFKIRDKEKMEKKLRFNLENFYGLYVGRGGYWTKGLDRAIKLSKEIYQQNKKYRLIVIGADYKKTKHLLNEKFIIYKDKIERTEIPYYYNVADVFFCFSRYEGGAPVLVVSEAMASGCLVVCAKSSEQEILQNEKHGLIITEFGEKEAKRILDILKNPKKKKKIITNSIKLIKENSLEKWGKKYLDVLLGK